MHERADLHLIRVYVTFIAYIVSNKFWSQLLLKLIPPHVRVLLYTTEKGFNGVFHNNDIHHIYYYTQLMLTLGFYIHLTVFILILRLNLSLSFLISSNKVDKVFIDISCDNGKCLSGQHHHRNVIKKNQCGASENLSYDPWYSRKWEFHFFQEQCGDIS